MHLRRFFFSIQPPFRALLLGLGLLSACAKPTPSAGTRFGNVEFIRAPDGSYVVRYGGEARTLYGFADAQVVGYWTMRDGSVLAIQGVTPDCPDRAYELVVVRADGISERRIDSCRATYRFAEVQDALVATATVGGRHWVYQHGRLSGPERESGPRGGGRAAPGSPADVAQDSPVAASPGSFAPVAAALKPPPVSVPVGDNVIPAQVPTQQTPPAIRLPGSD